METQNFEAAVAANEKAQAHALEIQQTRVGGLGGSDAAILLKIGENGLSALTATDHKRLAIMLGKQEQDNWGGNAYTNAGHAFEDYAEQHLPLTKGYVREAYMTQPLAINFKTFAHADFLDNPNSVIECKFVQDTTANTIRKYYAQLQWYYLLGANTVFLYHGTGEADPFEVHKAEAVFIERDETTIAMLTAGIKTLDEAIGSGWLPTVQDKIDYTMTPELVQRAFDALVEIKGQEAAIKAKKDTATQVIKEYLEGWNLTAVVMAGDVRHTAVYNKPQTRMTFNAEKFLQEHPEFDRPEYFKKSTVKSSVTLK